jgi:hypothetical protein
LELAPVYPLLLDGEGEGGVVCRGFVGGFDEVCEGAREAVVGVDVLNARFVELQVEFPGLEEVFGEGLGGSAGGDGEGRGEG